MICAVTLAGRAGLPPRWVADPLVQQVRCTHVNAALFDAIEYAATEARLGMGDLIDAYLAGRATARLHEVWDEVEDHLERIAGLHARSIGSEFVRIAPRVTRLAPPAGVADRRA